MSDSEAKHHASASGSLGPTDASSVAIGIVAPGDVIGGKFRVERVLGAGGMGVVVEARHVDLEDRVAIKLLLPAALEQPAIVARFRREARAAVKIKSEHIARVIDVGSLDDGAPYIVMEYLEGYDLSKPTQKHGRIPIPVVVDYLLQAAEAIAEAHTLGIVHRDIKPPNLFLTHRADGSACVKVLDFGISKVIGGLDSPDGETPEATLTQTSVVLGSPRYMAPEQISKPKSVDARADIWGIGATFYRLVTGHPPFEGNTLPEIFAAILMTPEGPPPIQGYCPEASAGLDAVIRRCMKIHPAERWQNIGDLATALAPFGSPAAIWSATRVRGILESAGTSAGIAAFPNGASASPVSSSGAALSNTLHTSAPTRATVARRNPLYYVVGAVGLAVIIAMVVLFMGMNERPVSNVASPAASIERTAPSVAVPEVVSVAATASQAPAAASASASTTARPVSPKGKSGPAKPKPTADQGGEELFDERN